MTGQKIIAVFQKNIAVFISTLVAIIAALGASGSAFYTRQIFEETKNQVQIAKDIASYNLLEQLGSGGPGHSCLMYFDALKEDQKNFHDALLEKNHFISNKEIFDKLQKCLGRHNIQIDEPSQYPYELKGVNAQKPSAAALTHLNLLDMAFQRIDGKSVNPCRILPTLKEYFIILWNIEALVKKVIDTKSPTNSGFTLKALLDGSKELKNNPDTVFKREKCDKK